MSISDSIDSIIFDLDGTLWDASKAAATAWNQVVERNSIQHRKINSNDVKKVTGRPHAECIEEVFHSLPENQRKVIAQETETEDVRVIQEEGGAIYPGVANGLARLKERFSLFIVSNCQKGYIETFYRHSGLQKFFLDQECFGNTGHSKDQNIIKIIKRNGLRSSIYIGDTEGDFLAAKKAGLLFAHAKYGFGEVPQADFVLREFNDLLRLLEIF